MDSLKSLIINNFAEATCFQQWDCHGGIMDFRGLKLTKRFEEELEFGVVKAAYDALSLKLNLRYKLLPTRTSAEHCLARLIRKETNLQVMLSVWINRRNVDLFIPGICGRSSFSNKRFFKGLAIEVDGDVHNLEFKMRKDNAKYEQLHQLDIALYTVQNSDVHQKTVADFRHQLSGTYRLDSRGKKRVLRNIYISTLIANQAEFDLSEFLTSEQLELIDRISRLQ